MSESPYKKRSLDTDGMAGKDRERRRENTARGDAGRDGGDAATSQGTPGRQKLGEVESRSPSAFRGSMVLPTPQSQTSSF